MSVLFNYGHTFFIDPAAVGNSSVVGITSINLFFAYRPNFQNNVSNINFPGITLYLTETIYGAPKVTAETFNHVARAEWNSIFTSSDGSQPTNFRFANPVQLKTGFEYAFLVSYDGNEQFLPWFDRKGYILVGTQTPSPGPSSPINGQYYEFVNNGTLNQLEAATTQSDYLSWWSPLNNVWLKFEVNAARYATGGVPIFANASISSNTFVGSTQLQASWNVSTNTTTISFPANRMEAVSFNRSQTTKQAFVGGQRVWQNTVFTPGGNSNFGTLSCNMSNTITANTSTSNGVAFSWNTLFSTYTGDKYIVIFDSSGQNIRKVTSIISNTQILVDEPVTFVNAAAKFMITPVATVDSFNAASPGGNKTSLMFLSGSNANATVRFTSCSIDPTQSSVSGGTGYSNSDVLYLIGYEFLNNKIPAFPTYAVGNYWAVANLQTNTTGGITSTLWSNVGAGFVNASAIAIVIDNAANSNPATNTSAGTGATGTFVVGSTICTELSNNVFRSCNVVNIQMHYANPFFSLHVPNEVDYNIGLTMNYYSNTDAAANGGVVYYINPTPQVIQLQMNQINRFNNLNAPIPAFVSRSNEFITLQPSGSINNQVNALAAFSNAYSLQVNTVSISDFAVASVNTIPLIEFAEYIINNDYSGENQNSGNAYAKHITTQVAFSGNNAIARLSEDLRVYLIAYRPASTNIQVFARIQNSIDSQQFQNEDWTRMQIVDGANSFSSPTVITDFVQLTYGFQQTPNTDFTTTGAISTSGNSSVGNVTLTGSNTLFTTELAVNDLIKLYDPLFPNTNLLIASVLTIASNVSLTIDQPISSNSAVGVGGNQLTNTNGLKIDRIRSFEHQAFNNIWASNTVRYYNSSQHIYDGFDVLQIKLVMLSSDTHQIPRIHSLRGIGVSA